MAIKTDITMANGIEVKGAYIRIEQIKLEKTSMSFNVTQHVTADKESFKTIYQNCVYDIDGANPFIQAYEYLKTLEEFADAIDC